MARKSKGLDFKHHFPYIVIVAVVGIVGIVILIFYMLYFEKSLVGAARFQFGKTNQIQPQFPPK